MNVFGRRERKRRKLDCLPQRMPAGPSGLNAYEACYYSQNGEDGIVAEIFRRIGAADRYVVELGVEDGRECNSANLIRHSGWSGVLIEGDPQRHARLGRNYRRFPRVRTLGAYVDVENVCRLLAGADVPAEFDLLSVDVDGNDYWVLREILGTYRPRVVIAEINPFYPPPARWIMPYDARHRWDDTTYFGASLCAMTDMHNDFGYALVAIDCNVVNAFFVRRELLGRLGTGEVVPECVYHFTPSFPGRRYGYKLS